jgi:hypothetical protein
MRRTRVKCGDERGENKANDGRQIEAVVNECNRLIASVDIFGLNSLGTSCFSISYGRTNV